MASASRPPRHLFGPRDFEHYLTVAAVVKDEARFVVEWIEHHRVIGVEHFLLFDDESNDETVAVLRSRYGSEGAPDYGCVTLLAVPSSWKDAYGKDSIRTQLDAFDYALHFLADRAFWTAFIDPDEFLYPMIPEFQRNFGAHLKRFERFSGIVVRGVLFGSSGRVEAMREGDLVTETFTHRGELVPPECNTDAAHQFCQVKSIVQPKLAVTSTNSHVFGYTRGNHVDENKLKVPPWKIFWKHVPIKFRFNHYKVKTLEDWERKVAKGVVQGNATLKYTKKGNTFEGLDMNQHEDRSLMRFNQDLRKRLGLPVPEVPARYQLAVLGMHRSGTSALTALLHIMGAYAGPTDELIQCSTKATTKCITKFNPKGYWERRDLVTMNDELLTRAGYGVWKMTGWHPSKANATVQEAFGRSVRRMLHTLDASRPWVIKDPRLCLTFGNMMPFLKDPVVILEHRHPLGVARSLRTRDKWKLPRGAKVWEKYSVAALTHSLDAHRILVSFEEMMEDPVKGVAKLYNKLVAAGVGGLRLPSDTEINEFYSQELYHHRIKEDEPELKAVTEEQLTLHNRMVDESILDEPREALEAYYARVFELTAHKKG